MMAGEGSLLLALPDPCLLRVLQFCAADDYRSPFSAARAHSRLQQAAVLALHSIKLDVSQQQQLDDVMMYLGKHSQLVNSVKLKGVDRVPCPVSLRQLPQQLQISSLELTYLQLQLQPGNRSQGMLGAAAAVAALKQLRLVQCEVVDNEAAEALVAALSQLPAGLEHLCINDLYSFGDHAVQFPSGVLQQLPHLTYLQIAYVEILGPDEASPAFQPLQDLTKLVELQLKGVGDGEVITSNMLSGMQQLTRLELSFNMDFEPGALAGKTQLQHLCLSDCGIVGGAAGVAQLLSHLQPLQQLTHLSMHSRVWAVEEGNPPALAYAALTASSKLQHLDISSFTLPAHVWQHLFPAGRQLLNLQSLNIGGVRQPGDYALPPECSRLVSCCPSLQSLQLGSLGRSAELLAQLQGLSRLQALHCNWEGATSEVVQAVCQLTGLKVLQVWGHARMKDEGTLLQLTQLKQLTMLHYELTTGFFDDGIHLSGEVNTSHCIVLDCGVSLLPPCSPQTRPGFALQVMSLPELSCAARIVTLINARVPGCISCRAWVHGVMHCLDATVSPQAACMG
jgi:hypothetical protein